MIEWEEQISNWKSKFDHQIVTRMSDDVEKVKIQFVTADRIYFEVDIYCDKIETLENPTLEKSNLAHEVIMEKFANYRCLSTKH